GVGRHVLPEHPTLGRGTSLSPFTLGQAPAHPTGGHDKYQTDAVDRGRHHPFSSSRFRSRRGRTDPDAERALLARLPVTEISGIASRRAARLAPHGISTCWDLAGAKRLLVRYLLTRAGEALWYELNGDPVLPLHTERPPHKLLSR